MSHTNSTGSLQVSVVVMTLNEEVNIARCLSSVSWSNDVVVLDSGSTDATREIAARFPHVRIFERPFTNYADQRNFALHQIPYANEWLFVLDADEEVGAALAAEIASATAAAKAEPSVYLVRRRVVLEGRVLRWNISSCFWIERLIRPERAHYVGVVHERLKFEGAAGKLRGHILHHQFDKGVDDWLARRMRYAALSAGPGAALANPGGAHAWRFWLKQVFMRLPARWAIYYLFNLIFALAFLDGRVGLRYIGLEARSLYLAHRIKRRAA